MGEEQVQGRLQGGDLNRVRLWGETEACEVVARFQVTYPVIESEKQIRARAAKMLPQPVFSYTVVVVR